MDRLSTLSAGLATALTFVVLNAICAAIVALWPDGALNVINSFAHGLDLRAVKSAEPMGIGRFFIGLISLGLIGFAAGTIFAWVYNFVARE